MANTVIQLKFSNITATPTTLNVAEPAYSYTSNTLFIGSPAGTGSIAIGGKFYLDQQQDIYNTANAAFNAANTGTNAVSAFNQANAAFATANSAAIAANTPSHVANSASTYANGAFAAANTADNKATSAGVYANGAFAAANTADNKATSAGVYANGAFVAANSAQVHANFAYNHANAGFNKANTAQNSADAAFIRANNSLNANTGGTIAGDLSITGNLNVTGNVVSISTSQIVANDSLIILAAGNYTTDILDIGFAGHYNDGANAHTGIIRDAGTKEYQLFEGYTPEITANNNIDINDPSFKLATLRANLKSQLITLNGQNLQTYVDNAYNKANAAFDSANSINGVDVTQNNSITAAFTAANSAGVYANGAFVAANTADNKATSAGVYANGAFIAANTADNKATSAGVYANGAFVAANSAQVHANFAYNHANGAFDKANTDFTGISITAAHYGKADSVAAFRVEANGRISSANSTAIAIDTSAITSGTLGVTRGGTGAGTFTNNGVLLGQGTSALTTASSATEGHVLTINASGVPTFAHLQGGTF